jgi:hypothetical protein
VLELIRNRKPEHASGVSREALVAAIKTVKKDRLWEGP